MAAAANLRRICDAHHPRPLPSKPSTWSPSPCAPWRMASGHADAGEGMARAGAQDHQEFERNGAGARGARSAGIQWWLISRSRWRNASSASPVLVHRLSETEAELKRCWRVKPMPSLTPDRYAAPSPWCAASATRKRNQVPAACRRAPAAGSTARPDGALDYVNRVALDYFGRVREETIGQCSLLSMPMTWLRPSN